MNQNKTYNVAMVGATGAVGEMVLSILKERNFPVGELVPLASERSAGGKVSFGNREITVKNLADHDFDGIDIAFFSAGGGVKTGVAHIGGHLACGVVYNNPGRGDARIAALQGFAKQSPQTGLLRRP